MITNEALTELRQAVQDGVYEPTDIVPNLIAKIDEQAEIIINLQQVAAARYADPDFLDAKIYAIDKERNLTGFKIFRHGRHWQWAWVEPEADPQISEENFSSQVEALRGAADEWDLNGMDSRSRLGATLRGLATRLEDEAQPDTMTKSFDPDAAPAEDA